MNIQNRCLICSVLLAVFASGEEVPKQLLDGLSADQYKQREEYQVELEKWVNDKGATAISSIYGVYTKSDDPEVRSRCLRVLRAQSDKEYLNEGQGYLGVQLWEEIVGLPGDDKPRVCARVTFIMPDSQAELAGIRVGDVLTALDGKKWYERGAMNELIQIISSHKPLRKVIFQVKRVGEAELIEVPVILGKRPVADLRMMGIDDLKQLEKEARDAHFKEWLKKQSLVNRASQNR